MRIAIAVVALVIVGLLLSWWVDNRADPEQPAPHPIPKVGEGGEQYGFRFEPERHTSATKEIVDCNDYHKDQP